MAKGRAYMRADADALYRVKVASPKDPGIVRILGPYGTVGAARGQASSYKRAGWTVDVQVARPVWASVDGAQAPIREGELSAPSSG